MRLQEEKEGEMNAEDSGVKWVLTKLLSFITGNTSPYFRKIRTAKDDI